MNYNSEKDKCSVDRIELDNLRDAIMCILNQSAMEIEHALLFSNRMSNKNIAKCVRTKLHPTDKVVLDNFLNNEMTIKSSNQLIETLRRNKNLMVGNSETISEGGKLFLEYFKRFINKSKTNLDVDRSKNSKENKTLVYKNVKKEDGIADKVEKTHREFSNKFEKARADIYEKHIENVKTYFDSLINREIEKTKPRMEWDWKVFENIQPSLIEQLKKATEIYESAVKTCMSNEKEAKKIKQQIDHDLYSIIDKYDTEMISKHEIYEELLREKDEKDQQLNDLKDKFKIQQEQFEEALREREVWEHEDIDRQLDKLKSLIGNRIITTFLKEYVKTYKLKKGKKNK